MRVNAKIEEAKAKRTDYDTQKAHLEEVAKSAVEASATLKDSAKTRSALLKEKEEVAAKVGITAKKLALVRPRSTSALLFNLFRHSSPACLSRQSLPACL